jgi:hypothetical protein
MNQNLSERTMQALSAATERYRQGPLSAAVRRRKLEDPEFRYIREVLGDEFLPDLAEVLIADVQGIEDLVDVRAIELTPCGFDCSDYAVLGALCPRRSAEEHCDRETNERCRIR